MLAIHFSEERVTSTVVSIYPLATSIGGLVGSKHSKFCGYSLFMVDNCPSFIIHRWPSAQLSMVPVMILGSFGVAGAQTVLQLMFWRIIQGMGASPSLSIGAGVTGDIYGLERQRFGSGGIFRTMFCLITHTLLVMASHSITSLLLSHLALFSTFYPSSLRQAILEVDQYQESGRVLLKWRPMILNPLPQLLDLRSPTVLAVVRNFCLNSLERTDL